ncbi:MAG: hypothetical protein WBG36_01460 [Ornithinimicrobium sp.]
MVTYWKMRDRRTGLFSTGGIAAHFNNQGRTLNGKIGVKGSLFHYVYGFRIDPDGVRRFHQRRENDSIDDYEAVQFLEGVEKLAWLTLNRPARANAQAALRILAST